MQMAGRAALSRDDMERIIFFEQAKEAAHADVEKNPRDATALTQLGGALLELSHFQNMPESYQMIQEVSTNINPHSCFFLACFCV